MKQRIITLITFFLIALAGGFFANYLFSIYLNPGKLEPGPVFLSETKEIYVQENVALVKAIEKVNKTVVGVKTKTSAGKILEGSALVVTSDGLIVTLAELVPLNGSYSFFVEGEEVAYQILKRDVEHNLALVKITEVSLKTVGFANLEKLKIGERVFLLGVVGSSEETLAFTVNEGIVTNFDKVVINTNIVDNVNLKGSPLFNIEGEILGLNMISTTGKVSAIPISEIRNFIGL